MTTLTYSAIGTAPQYRINFDKLDPKTANQLSNMLISINDPAPTEAEADRDAKMPQAAQIRQQVLAQMGMTQKDIANMSSAARARFEDKLEIVVHQQIMSGGSSQGVYINTKA